MAAARPIDVGLEIPSRTSGDASTEVRSTDYASRVPSWLPFLKADHFAHLQELRRSLKLPYPGTVEHISKEVQMDVQLSRLMFSGIRADITKVGSISPSVFHLTHSFSAGSQVLPPYSLSAAFATNRVFMNGSVDNDGSVSGRFHVGWSEESTTHTTKIQTQTTASPGQSMLQLEHDWRGSDFSINVKTVNPSVLDGEFSAVSIFHYLQSVTPSLALGLEAIWQKPPSTAGRGDLSPTWVASGQFSPQGILNMCFWKKLSPKVEAGVECQLIKATGPMGQVKSEGTTTLSAKYDYLHSTLRAQLDTKGKLQCLFEKRLSGAVSLTFAAALDHFKNTAIVGMGVNLEMPAFDDPNMSMQ
ncbi:translocase of outer mitochondrial membrane [Savitreella phatthalungensis]